MWQRTASEPDTGHGVQRFGTQLDSRISVTTTAGVWSSTAVFMIAPEPCEGKCSPDRNTGAKNCASSGVAASLHPDRRDRQTPGHSVVSPAGLSPLPTRSEPSLFAGSEGGLDAVPDIQLPEYLLNVRLDGVLA